MASKTSQFSAGAQSSDRSLAVTLPSLTFTAHAFVFLVLALHISSTAREDIGLFERWFTAYNLFAAGASFLGLIGAVRMSYTFVSVYTLVHFATLLLTTSILLNVILPFDLNAIVPILPNWSFDANSICREVDDGLNWDDDWLQQCRRNFGLVKVGLACFGLALVAAQWWAVVGVWRWGRTLQEDEMATDRADVEKRASSEKNNDPTVVSRH